MSRTEHILVATGNAISRKLNKARKFEDKFKRLERIHGADVHEGAEVQMYESVYNTPKGFRVTRMMFLMGNGILLQIITGNGVKERLGLYYDDPEMLDKIIEFFPGDHDEDPRIW